MTTFAEWLDVQNGATTVLPTPANSQFGPNIFKTIGTTTQKDTFYLYDGRMGCAFVHVDELYQAYFMAALNLLDSLKFATYDPNLPYQSGQATSAAEAGFGTFGNPHVEPLSLKSLPARSKPSGIRSGSCIARFARKPTAVWASDEGEYRWCAQLPASPLDAASDALTEVFAQHGTWLLPMSFPEGSPQHPSYGSGHATVAGACATIIKAFFDEDMPLLSAGSPIKQADSSGKTLVDYNGTDASDLTIMTEANKIAGNVGMFRNHAGVHWRSDHVQSILLGEQIAISILQDQKYLYNEPFAGWTFTTFAGDKVVI